MAAGRNEHKEEGLENNQIHSLIWFGICLLAFAILYRWI